MEIPLEHIEFEIKLKTVLIELESLLIQKNLKYGNAALNPLRIFSKSSPTEQLLVRIDDKLSRINNQHSTEDEDVLLDLLGYLILLKIAKSNNGCSY